MKISKKLRGFLCMAVFVSALLFSAGCSRREVALPISDKEIDEAVKFGKDNSSLTNTEFVSKWTLDSGGYMKGEGIVTIVTPFLRVALMSKKSSAQGSGFNRRFTESVLAKEAGFLHFEVTLFGDSYAFGRTVDFLLLHEGKDIKPVEKFMPSYAEMARDYTCIASGWVKFDNKDIPKDATVRLSVRFKENENSKETKKLEFNFNLKEFR